MCIPMKIICLLGELMLVSYHLFENIPCLFLLIFEISKILEFLWKMRNFDWYKTKNESVRNRNETIIVSQKSIEYYPKNV